MESDEYALWKGWRADGFGTFTKEQALYYRRELSMAGVSVLANKRLIEIGFGNGAFARWAIEQSAEYIGTEINEQALRRAKQAGWDVRHADNWARDVAPSSIDVIVAWDVFEHMSFKVICAMLKESRTLLRNGGMLIARVPSADSPFSRAIQYGDSTHCTSIGSGMVQQLAARSGLALKQVRSAAFPVVGLGLRSTLRRALVVLARTVVFTFLWPVFYDNQRKVLSPNMTFVLRKDAD
jgi:cyclopropane fatty-acyl-phospholipid synthase-like methyltransferase